MQTTEKLYKLEAEAAKALKLESFKELNLSDIKDKLSSMLSHIGTNGMFNEYTKHDITHVNGMLKLAEIIIPEKTWGVLTPADWLLLVLSIYFHDLGMLITEKEFSNREDNQEFQNYKESLSLTISKEETDKHERVIYQDYVRLHHGNRIYEWIVNARNLPSENENPVERLLHQMIGCLNSQILQDLAMLCKSHQMDLEKCIEILKPNAQYEQDSLSFSNLLYVASILRTADLLHINSERTPEIEYLLISPQNNYSRREWVKQKSVNCIRVKKEIDREDVSDLSLEQHRFEILATFDDEEAYSQLQLYLDDAEKELKKTYHCCADSQRRSCDGYYFPWFGIDRDNIKAHGFNAEKLKFDLDKDNILKLLIGHTLYGQANVVLRELTQNAIDACRLMKSLKKQGSNNDFKVTISWNSRDRELIIADNGTGMNEYIILNYLFKVGVSRYQSHEFKEKYPGFHSISRFGIGLLTCFMISDEIDITTRYYDEKSVHSIKIRNLQGEFYMRNDAKGDNLIDKSHGTTLLLKVRKGVELEDIELALKKWIIIPKVNVTLFIDGNSSSIGYPDEMTAMKSSLSEHGINVDGRTYKLASYSENGTNLLLLLHKNELYNYWAFATPPAVLNDEKSIIGNCVEGIMVEDNTPGYDNRPYVALLNCTGKDSPTTNVARDRIEDSGEMRKVQAFIYHSYFDIVQKQIKELSNQFNVSWSVFEANYTIDKLASYTKEYYNLSYRKIFEECFRYERCMLLDNAEECNLVSISEIPDEICTIESQAYSSAFSLVQEVKDCPKTPLKIVQELLPELSDVQEILADNLWYHFSAEMFLQEFQVSALSFDIKNRKINFGWKRHGKYWNTIRLNNNSSRSRVRNFFVLREDASVNVNNVNGEMFIVSKLGIFLFGDNDLRTYLNEIISKKGPQIKNVLSILSDFICRVVRSEQIQTVQYFDKFFDSDDNYLHEGLWGFVDKDRFSSIMKNIEVKKVDFNKYYNRSGYYWY